MTADRRKGDRDRWARLRFAIVGPLLAAPPAKGQLQAALKALSERTWQHPVSGKPLQFGLSTLERWLYAARHAGDDPVTALRTRIRADAGQPRQLSPAVIDKIKEHYESFPSWSIQLHYDNLRAVFGDEELPSYATMCRYFDTQGLRKLRRGTEVNKHFAPREVRSFEMEHVNALWHLDYHDGSRSVLTANGQWVKPYCLCIIDDRSRLACHIQWYLDVTARHLVHGFKQALMRRVLPRAVMTDNGSAMIAAEFTNGLHELGILHQPTLPRTPWANGKQERVWGTLEGRLMAMLEGVENLTLDLLNKTIHAWVEGEYHQNIDPELGFAPLQRYREGPDVGRECPAAERVHRAFQIEVDRRLRRTDGTISLDGKRFEIPSEFAHMRELRVRYARFNMSDVDLIDPRTGAVLAPLYPLNKTANAAAWRRVKKPIGLPRKQAAGMAPLLKKLVADFEKSGLPPPYLPDNEEEP